MKWINKQKNYPSQGFADSTEPGQENNNNYYYNIRAVKAQSV
jgi:hypothetical protein